MTRLHQGIIMSTLVLLAPAFAPGASAAGWYRYELREINGGERPRSFLLEECGENGADGGRTRYTCVIPGSCRGAEFGVATLDVDSGATGWFGGVRLDSDGDVRVTVLTGGGAPGADPVEISVSPVEGPEGMPELSPVGDAGLPEIPVSADIRQLTTYEHK